jgi:hypothetical protein
MLSPRAIRNGLLFLAGCSSFCHAAILTVSNNSGPGVCSNAAYTTIGAALFASASGDEIDICPGLYPEQLVITQPVTLRGLATSGNQRVLIQPATITNVQPPLYVQQGVAPFQAVISVIGTNNVSIQNLAINASGNTATGCTVTVADIHFSNASGTVANNALSGAQLSNPLSCTTLFPGNGFGVQVDTAAGQTGPFSVSITGNSIHDFNRNGVLVNGAGITAEVSGNTISGVGPSTGYNQFGVFVALGAVAYVSHNMITEGNCGTISVISCIPLRSEGVVFRAAGPASVVDSNFIANVQSGIFLNGANQAQISNNVIMNVDALDGIDIQGSAAGYFTNSVILGNTITHVFPISSTSGGSGMGSCGINEAQGTGVAQNLILNNTVNDAYCGVAAVTADQASANTFSNTLYGTVNANLTYPPALEP